MSKSLPNFSKKNILLKLWEKFMVDESTKKMLEEQFPGWKVVELTPHIPNPHLKNIRPGPDIEQLKAKYKAEDEKKEQFLGCDIRNTSQKNI